MVLTTTTTRIESPIILSLNRLIQRPTLLVVIGYVVLFGVIKLPSLLNLNLGIPNLYALMLFLPPIPALVIEERIYRLKKSEPTKTFPKIMRHRLDFLLGGFVGSIFVIPTAIALKIVVTKFYFYSPAQFLSGFTFKVSEAEGATILYTKWYRTVIFTIILVFIALYVTTQFFKTYTRFHDGKESLYFNSRLGLRSLVAYYMVGANFIPLILWLSNHHLYSGKIYPEPINQLDFIDKLNQFSLTFVIILTMVGPLLIMWNIEFLEHVIYENEIHLPKLSKIRNWLLKTVGLIGVIMFLTHSTLSSSNIITWFHLSPIVYCGIATIIMAREPLDIKECSSCHYTHASKDCPICDISSARSILLMYPKKVKHPRCPNCLNLWSSMSRQCKFCQYSIILSCEHCMNTINPLWTKCNLCRKPRDPVPNIALSPKSSKNYVLSRSKLILLALMLLPLLFYEISFIQAHQLILGPLSYADFTTQEIIAIFTFDDYIRIIAIALSLVFVVGFILVTRPLGKQSVFILNMQIAYTGANSFFLAFYLISLYELVLWTIYLLQYRSYTLIVLFVFILFFILLILNVRKKRKKLREFSLYVRGNGNDLLVLRG